MNPAASVSLVVFEVANCLMAVPASEVSQLEERRASSTDGSGPRCDLEEYFAQRESDGPWLKWARGARSAWLRVQSVVDVVSVPLGGLKPLPKILRSQARTDAFLAAGVSGGEVFLLLDPARLRL